MTHFCGLCHGEAQHPIGGHGWIPDDTPILEGVFLSLAPDADNIRTGFGVGIFDSIGGVW